MPAELSHESGTPRNNSVLMPLLGLLGAIALLLAPLPIHTWVPRWLALVDELENFGHFVLAAFLALVVLRTLRRRWPSPSRKPLWLTLGGALMFAVVTEGMQQLIGRDAAWIDATNDVLGALFVLLLHVRAGRTEDAVQSGRRRRRLVLASAGIMLVAASPLGWTLAAYWHRSTATPVLWLPDSALFDRFARWREGSAASLRIDEPYADWSAYTALLVEMRARGAMPCRVMVRVHDLLHNQEHEDRFNRAFMLQPEQSSEFRISIEEIRTAPGGREMDMTAIRGIVVFQLAGYSETCFDVEQVRLEK